jgi:DNA-directed RNA polymerase subunit M/transcription elongation factor TFIIS
MEFCPECGGQMIRQSGCIYCSSCGYSICLCSECLSGGDVSNYIMDDDELIVEKKVLIGKR